MAADLAAVPSANLPAGATPGADRGVADGAPGSRNIIGSFRSRMAHRSPSGVWTSRAQGGERTARVLAGYRRTAGERGRGQARPFGAADLAAVLATCHRPRRRGRGVESNPVARERGRLDAVIAGLLFMAGMRRSEVGALHWSRRRTPNANADSGSAAPPASPSARSRSRGRRGIDARGPNDGPMPSRSSATSRPSTRSGAPDCPRRWPTPGPPSSSRTCATSTSSSSTSSCRGASAETETPTPPHYARKPPAPSSWEPEALPLLTSAFARSVYLPGRHVTGLRHP